MLKSPCSLGWIWIVGFLEDQILPGAQCGFSMQWQQLQPGAYSGCSDNSFIPSHVAAPLICGGNGSSSGTGYMAAAMALAHALCPVLLKLWLLSHDLCCSGNFSAGTGHVVVVAPALPQGTQQHQHGVAVG